MKQRLDKLMLARGLVGSRSEAENWIRLGRVRVGGRAAAKPGLFVDESALIELAASERYVSRAGLKLAGAAKAFNLNFRGKKKVYAVDVGTDQLHPSLRGNKRIELYEKTDIRYFVPSEIPDMVVIDVSFISLRQILPYLAKIVDKNTMIIAMTKPQFEAQRQQLTRGGVVKNDGVRRAILREFEQWARANFIIIDKVDSEVKGAHGNLERFYILRKAGSC